MRADVLAAATRLGPFHGDASFVRKSVDFFLRCAFITLTFEHFRHAYECDERSARDLPSGRVVAPRAFSLSVLLLPTRPQS